MSARHLLALALLGASLHAAAEPVVRIYNWFDYIAPDTLENFRKDSGITPSTTSTTATRCSRPSCSPATPATTWWCPATASCPTT